jgi:hypothetical protein
MHLHALTALAAAEITPEVRLGRRVPAGADATGSALVQRDLDVVEQVAVDDAWVCLREFDAT